MPDAPIDYAILGSLALLDAREFLRFLPWMHARTVVGFHDTGPHLPARETPRAIEAGALLVSPLPLPTPRGVMLARVDPPRATTPPGARKM